jgi:hypothetical protein
VFQRLRAAIVGLTLVPCIGLSPALPTEHWHHAGPHHAHATLHQHGDALDHDRAELSPGDAGVVWVDRIAVQRPAFRGDAPAALTVRRALDTSFPTQWIAVDGIETAPPHGPPRPIHFLRGPPEHPALVS